MREAANFLNALAEGRTLSELRASIGGRKALHTEEAGINPVVLHSTADFAGLCRNLAFSLSLYSGQMCTAPQNIFIPRGGIATNGGHKSFDEISLALAAAVDALLADPARAMGVLEPSVAIMDLAFGNVDKTSPDPRGAGRRPRSGRAHWTFAALTAWAQRTRSSRIFCPKASGVVPSGSLPLTLMRSARSGCLRIAATSV